MRNHCVNVLRSEPRKAKNIKTLLEPYLNSAGELDFNKVIEMPKELKTSMRPLEKACENPKSTEKYLRGLEEKIKEKNLSDYGYETPEDWARDNWGPEFNCYDFHLDLGKNSAVFDTLCDPPLHIIAQIAQQENTTLLLTYAEPNDRKYGQLKVNSKGECEFKDFVEETIPEDFHNEFPATYPPENKKQHRANKSYKKPKGNNKGINIL
jgi:hypothetical protein